MKRCPRCGESKPLADFNMSAKSKDGRAGYCQPCARSYALEWKRAHPVRVAWTATAGKTREAERKRATYDRRVSHDRALRKTFSITRDDYDTLLASQGGRCAICKKAPSERNLSVDHDHACCGGKKACGRCVRGLLCVRCNSCLGWFESFRAEANAYLEAAK